MVTSVNSISNTGSLTSTGIGSGLDVSTILSKLMAVEERPLTNLKTAASGLNTKLSTVGKMQGYFAALQTKANALTSPDLWGATAPHRRTTAPSRCPPATTLQLAVMQWPSASWRWARP